MFQGQFNLEDKKSGSPVFELVRDLYVINTWFKFEDKIRNDSKVIMSKGIHTATDDDDDADDDGSFFT